MVRIGTNSFQITMPVLLSDSHLAPPRLMNENSAIARIPITIPPGVRVPSVLTSGKFFDTSPTEFT